MGVNETNLTERIECREIAYGSTEYKETVGLRYKILRRPIGLKYTAAQLNDEKNDSHLGCFLAGRVVGCLMMTPHSETVVRMRQFAVEGSMQRRGIGRALVEFTEQWARERDFEFITLHARETALGFYEKLGYAVVGERFIEVTLPHFTMEKALFPQGE